MPWEVAPTVISFTSIVSYCVPSAPLYKSTSTSVVAGSISASRAISINSLWFICCPSFTAPEESIPNAIGAKSAKFVPTPSTPIDVPTAVPTSEIP